MSLAAMLSLNIAPTGPRSERYQANSGRPYPTSRGTPALNLPSNPPPESDSRRQWPAARRPDSPEIDWPALVRRCLDGVGGGPAAPRLRALLSLYGLVPRRGRSDPGRLH